MTRLKAILSLFVLLFCSLAGAQRNIRVSYEFQRKSDVSDSGYKSFSDMRLDVSGSEAVFYSEEMFLADSLSSIAFGADGNVVDQSAYDKRTRHSSANTELFHLDFSSGVYQSGYRLINHVFIGEDGVLDLPSWTLTDSLKTVGEYICKKAEAGYMGRVWSVWYTEEVPVNAGPWLLWGCPGLIVQASDSEGLFEFHIMGLEYIPSSRWSVISKNYVQRAKVQRMSVKDMETVKTRANKDRDYVNQMMGVKSTIIRDKNGNVIQNSRFRKYQPLTSESYWK